MTDSGRRKQPCSLQAVRRGPTLPAIHMPPLEAEYAPMDRQRNDAAVTVGQNMAGAAHGAASVAATTDGGGGNEGSGAGIAGNGAAGRAQHACDDRAGEAVGGRGA